MAVIINGCGGFFIFSNKLLHSFEECGFNQEGKSGGLTLGVGGFENVHGG